MTTETWEGRMRPLPQPGANKQVLLTTMAAVMLVVVVHLAFLLGVWAGGRLVT